MGCVYVPPGSRVRRFAEAVAWLWRLGPVRDSPDPAAVALGWQDDAVGLRRTLDAGGLAGAAVFAARPGPRMGPVPGRHRRVGDLPFGPGCRIGGEFYVLDGEGEPVVSSPLGVHAVRDGAWLSLGADPEASWGGLDNGWVLATLADFLVDVLRRPLVMLPPIGCARYDDVPGTAHHQLSGRAKSDRRVRRRIEGVGRRFAESGGRLNVAIPPRALVHGREVAADEVWPAAAAALRAGVEAGTFEPVYHGYLHLDTGAWASGRISPREFENVERDEVERRLDVAFEWFASQFGAGPYTFVAPTWAYGDHLLDALAARGVAAWLPAEPGPPIDGNAVRETVCSTMEGLVDLDYGPLQLLADSGLPPTVVIHGGLFDARLDGLRDRRRLLAAARLSARRDLFRAPWVEGVSWIGAAECVDRLRAHGRVEVSGPSVTGPAGTEVVVRDRGGSRRVVLRGA